MAYLSKLKLFQIFTFFFLSWVVLHATELSISPTTPIVEINKTITLSVFGTVGNVVWETHRGGRIEGKGTQIVYIAPGIEDFDIVTVYDGQGNSGTVKIQVIAKSNISPENAVWKIFTNRSQINALLLSEDGKTLWVGTNGGLEKRNAQTGEIQLNLTNLDGLPSNFVSDIISDAQGGLWIGTQPDFDGEEYVGGGLIHYDAYGQWQVFDTENSGLPNNAISSLLNDNQSGLWIGTREGGLAHYDAQGQWQIFDFWNSDLLSNTIETLFSDGQDGLWIGTYKGGLAHYAQNQWQVFDFENPVLPSNTIILETITSLLDDGEDGLWVGTDNGLIHDSKDQTEIFNKDNSGLPNNWITTLLPDSQGGLWIGTNGGGLVHYTGQGQWQVFNTENSNLPNNSITAFHLDNHGGLWVGTWKKGLAHYTAQGEIFNIGNLSLPSNAVKTLLSDKQGGLWIGTYKDGLIHYTAQGQWQVFNTENSSLSSNNIYALLSDDQYGLWIGTDDGLFHRQANGIMDIIVSQFYK